MEKANKRSCAANASPDTEPSRLEHVFVCDGPDELWFAESAERASRSKHA